MTVNSPCIRSCCLNEADICLGCFRSLEEILQWGAASDQRKQDIVSTAQTRKRDHANKYGA
ncbi:MAG: DUF1289 domain-containing protein [Halieaceae bacterium]